MHDFVCTVPTSFRKSVSDFALKLLALSLNISSGLKPELIVKIIISPVQSSLY